MPRLTPAADGPTLRPWLSETSDAGSKSLKKHYVKPEMIKRGRLSAITADSGSALVVQPSDIRLKTGVEMVGHAPNGLPLYTFSYIGSQERYRGVMAQDVLKLYPEAVTTMDNGFLAVRYDMLGLEMTRVH